jgi:hypothetical protein
MTVPVQTPRNVFTATAAATVFPYSFKIASSADLLVKVNGATRTLGVDFMVSGVGADSGGNVTFGAAMVGGEQVELSRAMPIRRLTDYQNLGDLRADTINRDFDALVMMLQQINEGLAQVSDPPPTTSAYVQTAVQTTVDTTSSAAVATLPVEAGKVYRVTVVGTARCTQSGSYSFTHALHASGGMVGTVSGLTTWHTNNASPNEAKAQLVSGSAVNDTGPSPVLLPGFASASVGTPVGFRVDMVVRCTTAGSLLYKIGQSLHPTEKIAQLDAGTLIECAEIRF